MKKHLPNYTTMKKFLSIVTIAAVVVACNPNPQPGQVNTATTTTPTMDTFGLAEFQAWKAQNELQNLNQPQQNYGTAATAPVRRTTSYAPQRTSTRSSSTARRSSGSSGRGSTASTGTRTTQKQGWSKAAKGAVIGGVTGGVAGAVINKRNRVVGGVVGAVIGAGGGYVIGRSQDKKDGRY